LDFDQCSCRVLSASTSEPHLLWCHVGQPTSQARPRLCHATVSISRYLKLWQRLLLRRFSPFETSCQYETNPKYTQGQRSTVGGGSAHPLRSIRGSLVEGGGVGVAQRSLLGGGVTKGLFVLAQLLFLG